MIPTFYHHAHDDYQSAIEAMQFWVTQTLNDRDQILRAVSFEIEQDFETKEMRYCVLVRGALLAEKVT